MQEALFEEPTLTVGALNAGIGGALQRAFPRDLWVRGEVRDLSRPASGHVYFDLCGDGCTIPVTLWASDRSVVNAVLRRAGGAVRITDGTEVRLRAQLSWRAERGRVALRMLSIDTAFTLGRLAEARELLVHRLRAEGVMQRQQHHALPIMPLRVGLITSVGSAAEADFLRTLEGSGRAFEVSRADARVQGVEAERSLLAALIALEAADPPLDVICIVRGGGAKTDLAAFDLEAVARAIASCSVPVLTGIGHEIDVSVADLVAHRSFKTPTACAGALVEAVERFCLRLDDNANRCQRAAAVAFERASARLHRTSGRVAAGARHHVQRQDSALGVHSARLATLPTRALEGRSVRLTSIEAQVRSLDPERILARGWSITRDADGRAVRLAASLLPGVAITTTFADGSVRSTVDG
ncbi:MAG: exodeoxyribonuclease VII large subunit [Acidimicrobiales bacterium]